MICVIFILAKSLLSSTPSEPKEYKKHFHHNFKAKGRKIMADNNLQSAKRRARILVIAPYSGLKNLFERVAADMGEIELTAFVSDTRDAANFVKTIDLTEYDIVISRGYTCTLIEEACGKHVLDVGISIYDVLAAIKSVQNYEGKFVFVGFQSVIYLATIFTFDVPSRR